MSRTIALTAGGTGGHMFPAQSLAEELCRRGHRVILLTDARGLRFAVGFPADDIVTLEAANPNVRGPLAKLSTALAMGRGTLTARKALRDHKADFVVGFGGYPSAPGLLAAKMTRTRYAVHEQNAVLGRVNRRAAGGAAFVAHGFSRLDRLPPTKGEVVHLGNPVRNAVMAAMAAYAPPRADDMVRVLIFGGSQGARLFADVFPEALASLPVDVRARLRIVHQVAGDMHDSVAATYRDAGIPAELAPFFDDLPARMAAAHFVIARSGASTVTELSTMGRPSLLIPLGIAMDDHQHANAEVLAQVGAATVLLERDLSPGRAAALMLPWLSDGNLLAGAAQAAKGQVPSNAAQKLADKIEMLLNAGG